MLLASYAAVTLMLVARPAQPWIVNGYEARTCPSPFGEIAYRVHVPENAANSPRPLVIWLHGAGESGNDNRAQLAWLEHVWPTPHSLSSASYYVLALQRPAEAPSWHQLDHQLRDPIDELEYVLDDVTSRYQIDGQRIYVAGISQGASGAWAYAHRFPQRFAGLLSLGAPESLTQIPDAMLSLPIWAFQSTGDGLGKVTQLRHLAADMKRRGGRMAVTCVASEEHDCWTAAFRHYHAWSWLLAQQQDAWQLYPPGWPPRRLAYTIAIGVAIVVACFGACRRRRGRHELSTSSSGHRQRGLTVPNGSSTA